MARASHFVGMETGRRWKLSIVHLATKAQRIDDMAVVKEITRLGRFTISAKSPHLAAGDSLRLEFDFDDLDEAVLYKLKFGGRLIDNAAL